MLWVESLSAQGSYLVDQSTGYHCTHTLRDRATMCFSLHLEAEDQEIKWQWLCLLLQIADRLTRYPVYFECAYDAQAVVCVDPRCRLWIDLLQSLVQLIQRFVQ